MTTGDWILVGVLVGGFWMIGMAIDSVAKKIDTLIGIAHRIRINDRERDF